MSTAAPLSPAVGGPVLYPAPWAVSPGPALVCSGCLRKDWTFEVFDQVDAIDPDLWREMFPSHWKDRRYYGVLEETFPDEFPQCYLVLRDGSRVRAIQPMFFVRQDLTASLSDRVRAWLAPWRRRLTVRMLMVGCVVGDGQVGVPDPADLAEVVPFLDEALTRFARHERVSLLLFKDFPMSYRAGMSGLVTGGRYLRMASLPAVSLPLDFADFDTYLETRLGKSTRKSLRRKFRAIDALAEPIVLEVKKTVTEAEADALHALYEGVALRGDAQFEVFTRDYFLKMAERMPDQARFFLWRQGERLVAFSFCVVDGDTLHDNDIGMDENLASALNLYHVTFRDIVKWSLAHGLKHYRSAPFNYDSKRRLRMRLEPLDLYARHTSPVFNRLLRWFAPLAAPTRQEPLLKEFANAAEL